MSGAGGGHDIRLYSEDDAQAILNEAIGLQFAGREFSRDHLMTMARELGITPEQLVEAERRWRGGRAQQHALADFRAYRRAEWRKHLFVYVVVNAAILLGNLALTLLIGTFIPFFLFVLVGWGIGLAIDGYEKMLENDGEDFERAFLAWQKRRAKRRARMVATHSDELSQLEQ